MKKILCFALILALLLSTAACGRKPEPTAEPTGTPAADTAAPTSGPEASETGETTREEWAAEYLRSRDRDYVLNNLGVYIEYYRLTHPDAELGFSGCTEDSHSLVADVYGADAEAFGDFGLLPEFVTLRLVIPPEAVETPALARRGYPEAALLHEGLPENVEAAPVGEVCWPALSCRWRLRERLPEDPAFQEEFWVYHLLGEWPTYDEEAGVWRAGDLRLNVTNGARLWKESKIARALELTLPLRQPDTLDPRDLPGLEESGWLAESDANVDYFEEVPILYLYAQRQEELTFSIGEGEELSGTLVTGGAFETCRPEAEVLNARLAAVLAERRSALGEEVFLEEYGDLTNFTFSPEDLEDVFLIRAPVRASLGGFDFEYVSPWGELEEAATWCLYSRRLGLLALEAPLIGYTLEPWESETNDSPWYGTRFPWRGMVSTGEESYRFQLSPEGGTRFTSLCYVLTAGNDSFRGLRDIAEHHSLSAAWLMEVEPASGEAWSCSVAVGTKYGYDFYERCYIQLLSRKTPEIFAAYREERPDADVWVNGWSVLRGEDGGEYLEAECYGADIPALEASGFLPERMKLNYYESPFNQKETHPCPHEPEWEKKYWSEEREDAITLTMAQAVYPLYPDYVEVTVKCRKSFDRDWYRFSKYVDGEWQDVFRILSGTLQFLYVEAGETTLQVPTLSRLGPGLYRLYLNQEYWVEFAVSEDPEASGAGEERGSFAQNSIPEAETERLIRGCTHIVKAEYAGTESWDRGEMLAFVPLETWKGEIGEERIYLQAEDPVLLGRQGFKKGDTVILLLNRHISVYWPHDIYTAAEGYELGALEKARVDSILANAPPPEKDFYGVEYTLSREVSEILEASECVFAVEPVSASFPEGRGTGTWLCRVRAALRGQPVYREIHIVFFPGDVEEGKEYLVLLNQVDGGTLYVLSSRNSVYPLEEAQRMEEFAALLALAGEVTASELPTWEELLAAEQAAAGKG